MKSGGAAGTPALRRDIGFTGSAFLAFNGVVGASIFALPATLYEQFGNFSPWLFPLFAGLVLFIVFPLAQLAARTSVSGGPAAYTAVFGPLISFEVGWLYYLARVAAMAANCNVFATYAAAFWPPVANGWPRAATIVMLIALLTMINVVGVRRAIRLLDALTLLKAAPLILLAIVGLAAAGASLQMPTALPVLAEVEVAALLVFYAFSGFENALVPADETADAKRTIPRALIATVLTITVLYFVVQLAYVAVMQGAAPDGPPLVAMATVLAGSTGGIVLTLAALFSVAGNMTSSSTSTTRVTFALARQGSLPEWFGRVSPRYATPANSIVFMGIVAALLAVSGSFVYLAVVSALAKLIVFGISFAALPYLRRAAGEPALGGLLNALLLGAGFAVCIWAAAQSEWPAWRLLFGSVVVGTVLYVIARRSAS